MLICPECNTEINTNVEKCHECGCPIKHINEHQKFIPYSVSSDIIKLTEVAKNGVPDAQYWLAYKYYHGVDCIENKTVAEYWLKKAKNTGHIQAQTEYDIWFNHVILNEKPVATKEKNYPLRNLFNRYNSIILLDTETTGLNCKVDQIIELAAIKVINKNSTPFITTEIDRFINLSQGRKLTPLITELTSITDDILLKYGSSEKDVCSSFASIFDDDKILIVAYNAQFDIGFLKSLFIRYGYDNLFKKIDMLDALTVYKDRRSYPHKLKNAITAYGLEGKVRNSHRAIDDVYSLFEVLKAMDSENSDLPNYINLFGYNPKYGINGDRIEKIIYKSQPYNNYTKLYEK